MSRQSQANTGRIALVGNPNSGKSTLFNLLTGLNQKVANFPGVTVEKKTGNFRVYHSSTGEAYEFEVTDLPGTYSLYPKSPDERIPFEVLCNPDNESYPDRVILVADGTNIRRSLFLASQVIDLKIPTIIVVNMMDLVRKEGIDIDLAELEKRLGVRIVAMNARKEEGLQELKQALINKLTVPLNDVFPSSNLLPRPVLNELRNILNLNSDYAAFQMAHHLESIEELQMDRSKRQQVIDSLQPLKKDLSNLQSYETLERYKVIREIEKDAVVTQGGKKEQTLTQKIDALLVHRFWGYLIFLSMLFVVFQAIFSWAQYPMEFIDRTFTNWSQSLKDFLPAGMLNDLLVNGVLAGIGGIVIFIPQIALLFAFVAILEDTGYMARVSFLMDKLMRKFGLNGRSVIPLMSGVACAVPAIMSTRTISSWRERLITIMVTPLMSCSARLPVYALIIALIIPEGRVLGLFNLQGLVMMSLYLIGFGAALGSAWLMKYFVQKKQKEFFIMELPVYRAPRWSNIVYAIIGKVRIFLFDAGKIIIAISIILWFLSSRGPGDHFDAINLEIQEVEARAEIDQNNLHELQAKRLESSYAGMIGKAMEPAIRPLGFDWKIGIALVTSFAAREVFVGTMSTIYSVGQSDESSTVLEKMRNEQVPEENRLRYDTATGWSLLLFYAFAMQCMSTLAVVKRETGSWKWPLFQFIFMSLLAYFSSMAVYQLLQT